MLFNSYQYILFLPIVLVAYFSCPTRWRWALLLIASYIFYMAWEPAYAILILSSTLVDYILARIMGKIDTLRLRKVLLVLSLSTNLGLLAAFKYFEFIRTIINDITHFSGYAGSIPALDVLLPVGISFYTFQTLSYTIDVYRGEIKPERHLGIFALYVSFFPQLVAGPIERSHRLLPQLKKTQPFNYPDAVEGLRLILWGLFKKMVIADRLAMIVNKVYDAPEQYTGPVLVLATLCFAYQIYCDFSGYSDIAIGSARMFGIRLSRNFNRPYHAKSIREFWQRWHISLSTWFRDYVYLSLGGNRCARSRWYFNILMVFVLSGLWHGANWTFLLWGLIHALLYLSEVTLSPLCIRIFKMYPKFQESRVKIIIQWAITFMVVNIAWVFFRADSISEALSILQHLHVGWQEYLGSEVFVIIARQLQISSTIIMVTFLMLAMLIIIEVIQGEMSMDQWLGRIPRPVRWMCYIVLSLLILNGGVTQEIPFVYFQF